MGFWDFFKTFGRLAFGYAKDAGLTDATIQLALKYVRLAEAEFETDYQKREWVIAQLRKVVPESIARLALELAIQLFHKELDSK